MSQLGPFLVLLVVMAAIIAAAGSLAAVYSNDSRRVRRGLRRVLESEPHALLVAGSSQRGVGFNFTTNMAAVAWEAGAWCLLYRIEEFLGAELIIDDTVIARAYRGELRRPMQLTQGPEQLVRLRLIFDDPRYPDFDLDLWTPAERQRRNGVVEIDAIHEGNRWIARSESLFRRKAIVAEAAVVNTRGAETQDVQELPPPKAVAPKSRARRAPVPAPIDDHLELPFALEEEEDDPPPLKVANG